jgi:hypothetical protein
MSLEQVCADLRRRPNGLMPAPTAPQHVDVPKIIARLIESNRRRNMLGGMDGCTMVFASYVEARTFKRMAAESLLICGRFRDGNLPRKGWQWWFDRSQQLRAVPLKAATDRWQAEQDRLSGAHYCGA